MLVVTLIFRKRHIQYAKLLDTSYNNKYFAMSFTVNEDELIFALVQF